ncbi:MAG: sensor histidine kinase [Anaerolineaceae bacterium]|nr:sensor histidine kinase [Anaerolineaceae bacterium]
MRELTLHLLDIAENSISAGAKNINIEVEEEIPSDCLRFSVQDDGKGMDAAMAEAITNPFVTSRTTRKVGLGIPLLKAAAEACCGSLTIESAPGKGARVEAIFKRSHIDRMPLGDLADTVMTLVIGSPEIHWRFLYQVNEKAFEFDDQPIKEQLEGVPLSEPAVLHFIREYIEEGIAEIKPAVEY